MKFSFILLTLLGLLATSRATLAGSLVVGDLVPVISAPDQNGKPFVSTNHYQFLLIATEMAAAKVANQKLAEQEAGFLELHHAAWLLDIHSMPAIARFFAFPKLRKYPQRIILVDRAEILAGFPAQAGRVTVVAVTPDQHIRNFSFWDPNATPLARCFP